MWPFILKLGIITLAGIGIGFALISHHEGIYREIQYAQNGRRERENRYSSNNRSRRRNSKNPNAEECQRKFLEDQLNSGTAECVICTEYLLYSDPVWPCLNCKNIFHLTCISRWARTNAGVTSQWNCPVCRKRICLDPRSLSYECMCGRVKAPKPLDGVTPHCCGQLCLRDCGNLCHPGPCSKKQ